MKQLFSGIGYSYLRKVVLSCRVEREVRTTKEIKKLSEKQIENRLNKYFDAHYCAYEETANHYPNPSKNSWVYDIEEIGKTITLTCDENTGEVKEMQQEYIKEQKKEINFDDYYVINPMKML